MSDSDKEKQKKSNPNKRISVAALLDSLIKIATIIYLIVRSISVFI